VPLSPSSIIAAGKVTVGLASHWPCITDSSGIATYGLMALEREMSTPPIYPVGVWHTLPYLGATPGISG